MTNNTDINVFVYGTLRVGRGNWAWHLKDASRATIIETSCRTKETDFIMAGGRIPFVNKSDASLVRTGYIKGDFFKVTKETLRDLDHLEGHPNGYRRVPIEILLKDGTEQTAWMYLYQHPGIYPNKEFFHEKEGYYEHNYQSPLE